MARGVMDAHFVAAERDRFRQVVERIDRRLRLDPNPEHHSLLHDGVVQRTVVGMQHHRGSRRRPGAADAGDVIEMGVRQQDVLDRQLLARDEVEQLVDRLAWIDDDAFARLLASQDVAVLHEGRRGAIFEQHDACVPWS